MGNMLFLGVWYNSHGCVHLSRCVIPGGNCLSFAAIGVWVRILALSQTSCMPLGMSLYLRILMGELDMVPKFLLHMED